MNIQGYGSGSFVDIMNSSHKRNQIPLVNQIVSYKDTEDGEIYRAYFTDDKVTSLNAVGQKAWETMINDVSHAQKIKESLRGTTLNGKQSAMFALLSYFDDTNQTNNTGISSFSKLRSFAEIAEMNGLCEDIKDMNSFYNKTQNCEEIMCAIKEVFLGNPQTYEQALNCDKLIDILG